jgi:two-component system NtrC family sensor kinase
MLVLYQDETIAFSNDAVGKLFGYKIDEITGRRFSDLFLLTVPEDQAEFIVKEGIARGWDGECLMDSKGDTFPAFLSFSPITDNEKNYGALVVIRDITRGKKTIHKRMHAEKMRALGEMLSSVAHDLNNPLASIVGYAELLEAQVRTTSGSLPPSQLIEVTQIINSESRRASSIVQNLLSFIRNDDPIREPLDVNILLEDTVKVFRRNIHDRNIQISMEMTPELPLILADPYMLQQVFMNILINAFQAIKSISSSGEIKVKTSCEKDIASVKIIDDGPGISQDIIKHIFDPFFTTKKSGMGTGLGLSISTGIISNHKGQIEVQNNKYRGATFNIKIPVTKLTRPVDMEPIEINDDLKSKFKSVKLLIVDDENVILNLTKKLLLHVGIGHVDIAEDGSEALKKMERYKYDLVIADIKMPIMNGLELYQCAQEDENLHQIPFIFITGNLLCSTTEEFLRRYKLPFINKPFAVTSLIKIIEKIISQK